MTFPFAAVLFDLDGTLVDSLGDLADAMNFALAEQGLPPHAEDKYRYFVGEGVENLARRALPEGQEERLPRLLADFRARYAAHFADRSRAYPGVGELLARLSAERRPMAVLSNKREDFTQSVVERLLPAQLFRVVRGERPGVPKKPDPAAALEVAALLGARPDACAFVGDTSIDMACAVRAGMVPIGALWGFRTRAELLDAGARALIAHPLALLDIALP